MQYTIKRAAHSSFHNPLFNIAGFRTEIYPDLKELPSIRRERKGVMLILYLSQSLFSTPIQFKFHDINEFIRLQDKVYATFARMIFHFGIEADQLKYNEKDILIM